MTTMKLGGLDYVTTHDNRGNQLTLGNQNYTYDARDRATGVSQNGAGQATYTRDAANRIISRTVSGSAIQFSFANGSDAPVAAYGTTGALLERYVGLLGGVMVRTTVYGWEWSLSNIAGSVVAQTSMNGTKIGTTTVYDPFGNAATALPNNRLGTFDAGWLGTVNRFTDQTADFAAIPMGARLYLPILNRFTQVDPVLGGVDNDYVWPTDPVNANDSDGTAVCRRRIAWLSYGGAQAEMCVINRKPSDRTRLLVRIQFEINVRAWTTRFRLVSGEVAICGSYGNCSRRSVSAYEVSRGKHKIHTSIALNPGEQFSVYGYVNLLWGGDIVFTGVGVVPDESVYDYSSG